MGVVGKNGYHRRRVRINTSSSVKTASSPFAEASAILTAAYIAEISGELRRMANDANLALLSHLLAMAQAEAEYVATTGN